MHTSFNSIQEYDMICILYVLFFLGQTQKIHHNKWFSQADTFGVHIDHFIFFLHPLIDPHFTKMFLCWLYYLRPLDEKQCQNVDRLEGEENK